MLRGGSKVSRMMKYECFFDGEYEKFRLSLRPELEISFASSN